MGEGVLERTEVFWRGWAMGEHKVPHSVLLQRRN